MKNVFIGAVNPKLIGSSTSLEGVRKLISEYWYSSSIRLEPISLSEWNIYNAKGLVNGFKVMKRNGRFRFVSLT